MKKVTAMVLCLCLSLSGCAVFAERMQEPVTFYYINKNYQQNMETVMVSEQREAAGHRDDLSYMMALYLMGPTNEDSVSPIPRGTRIFRAEVSDGGVRLDLSNTDETMSDAQFTIAAACLAMTCMELADAQQVTVISGGRSVLMTEETLIQYDDSGFLDMEEIQ